ncbi:hypothetical protein GCM10010145_17260 [Streptomyces ruber]|uniref:Uncharacterized protein n=2 Tax=Streptomyces TaxID=1883 RepID=A0A918B9K0_9ACTN|nr:hypothetical protein GCM10010145_17260 [Streptomyces ruber]
MRVRDGTRACEDRQGGAHGQQGGGYGHRLDAPVAGHDDGELTDRAGGGHGRPYAVRAPEGHTTGTCRITGHEDGTAAGQFGESGRWCRELVLHSDGTLLKFHY